MPARYDAATPAAADDQPRVPPQTPTLLELQGVWPRLLLLLYRRRCLLLLPLHSLMMQELLLRPLCICPRALLD